MRISSLDDDSALLWRYLSFEANQNAHELARILVNEGRSPTLEAALASIKRIKDPKSKRGKAAWDHLNWLISFSSSFFKREDLASRYK
jgi:hypothetical protein